jgi:hypothetical protein
MTMAANASMLRIPASVAGDSGDVTVALEVASALWDKGDNEEALRWMKRAVEAASEAGDAPRAASLAQAAGSLEAALEAKKEKPDPPRVETRSPSGGAVLGTRMRVSVKTSLRDPSLLLLRPLADGQLPPAGTREGFLVLADIDNGSRNGSGGGGAT